MTGRLFLLLALLFYAGCDNGYSFEPHSADEPLPEKYEGRTTALSDILGFEHHLNHVAGSIFAEMEGPNGKVKHELLDHVLKSGTKPPPVKDFKDPPLFHSVITTNWKVELSVLAKFAGKLGQNRTAELTIADNKEVAIPPFELPHEELKAWVKANPKRPQATRRFWVRAATLTDIRKRVFRKIEGSTTVTGVAFKVGGSVFHSNETITNDRQIWLSVIDVDRYQEAMASSKIKLPDALKKAMGLGLLEYSYGANGRLTEAKLLRDPPESPLPRTWKQDLLAYARDVEQAVEFAAVQADK